MPAIMITDPLLPSVPGSLSHPEQLHAYAGGDTLRVMLAYAPSPLVRVLDSVWIARALATAVVVASAVGLPAGNVCAVRGQLRAIIDSSGFEIGGGIAAPIARVNSPARFTSPTLRGRRRGNRGMLRGVPLAASFEAVARLVPPMRPAADRLSD